MKDLYILQYWYWDGDGYLVDSFRGIFDHIEALPEQIKNYIPVNYMYESDGNLHHYFKPCAVKKEVPCTYKGLYTDIDVKLDMIPDQNVGSYGSPGFYTFTSLTLNEFMESQ